MELSSAAIVGEPTLRAVWAAGAALLGSDLAYFAVVLHPTPGAVAAHDREQDGGDVDYQTLISDGQMA